jgi:hypothetical protein
MPGLLYHHREVAIYICIGQQPKFDEVLVCGDTGGNTLSPSLPILEVNF